MVDTTKLIIDIESRLRNLEKTLKGVDRIKKALQAVADVKVGQQSSQANANKAVLAAQKLAQQQQKLGIQSQELANRQEKARQTTERLAQSQQRLESAQSRLAKSSAVAANASRAFNRQQDAQVRDFRRQISAQQDLNRHVLDFRRLIAEAGTPVNRQADAHVRDFRRQQAALGDFNAHVRDFQRIQRQAADAAKAFQERIAGIGNVLRGVGQGLASVGATLSVALTAPLAALGAVSVDAAVRLDSLKRGLTAITGSSDEASRQLTRLTELAKLPGIGFEEAIQGSIRLQAVGFSAQEAERNLKEFANAIALTGGGRDELARVTIQLGQLAAKGKVLSQDLRPIIEAAPAVGRALLQAFGTVNSEDIQALGLSTKQFLDILVSQLGELPRAAAGAKNSFENFRDEIFRAAAVVGEALLPSLIRLVEVVGPVITTLADAFARLPGPVQGAVVGIGVLLATLGPVLFVVGQLTFGVGRLLVGFIELNVGGVLPTVASLRAMAAQSLATAAAQRVLASTTALVTAGIGTGLAIIGAVVAAYALYNATQKDAVTFSKERAEQLTAEIDGLEKQAKFLNGLESGVKRTADEQQRLGGIYDKLNTTAQIRIAGITDEEKRLIALRAELEKLIELRGQERVQQSANVAAQIAASATTIAANEKSRDSIAGRIAANNALVQILEREGRVTLETGKQLERLGITAGADVRQAIHALQVESARLVERQKELGDNTEETEKELEGYLEALRALDPQHRLSARQLLELAKNMGLFRGDIEQMVPVLERYIAKTNEATKSTDAFNRSLSENERRLNEAGKRADATAKARQEVIQSAAAVARETSVNFEGALKSLRQMVDAVPELAAALKRESELTGKTLNELLRNALETSFKGRDKTKSGTGLRNAQEQLAKALADVALASSEQQVAIEQAKNEQLLQQAEVAQRLQLISYREFLETRASLTAASLDKEIEQQTAVVTAAKNAQARLLAEAGKAGIPVTERTKRLAQAAEANETAVKAETKLSDLQAKRQLITDALAQSIRESQEDQLKSVRQLEIEYAELTGRIEAAANAATDEQFREALTDLGRAQDFLNKKLEAATKARNADGVVALKFALALNQRQIDAIENIKEQEDALASLAAANELIRRAKERQAQLEADLTFQVEFRGLSEEAAIARRLEGESKLNDSLTVAHETIRQIVAALQARGVEPPQALVEFLDTLRTEVKGLGKLSFSEQFRLAQKEFDRINDLRLQKIADVERAARNRDIAEAEGLLLIRRINGEYVGDLEQQLVLLKQIASASGDVALQRQATDAAQVAKDAGDQLASLDAQIRSTSIDALQDGFTDFFKSITDRTQSAQNILLAFVNSVAQRINDVIAEHLGRELIESLFGTGGAGQEGGIIAAIKRVLGIGGGSEGATGKAVSAVDAVAGKAALETGAVAAATTLQTGAATASITFSTSVATTAAAFASAVIAAGAGFAASVAASAAVSGAQQAIGGLGGALGAATGMFADVPGGAIRVLEGGYPEAILTTDPRHAVKQVSILREFLQKTRGLGGRIPGFALGGMVSRETAEANLLSGIHRAPSFSPQIAAVETAAGGGGVMNLRITNQVSSRAIARPYATSEEGVHDLLNNISQNSSEIRRRLRV